MQETEKVFKNINFSHSKPIDLQHYIREIDVRCNFEIFTSIEPGRFVRQAVVEFIPTCFKYYFLDKNIIDAFFL